MVDGVITYLNTDLDLVSDGDLTELAAAFVAAGLIAIPVTHGNGLWYAMFEAPSEINEPEQHIAAMLSIVESLPAERRREWDRCSLRQLDLGYDCGDEPWGFHQELSAELVRRIGAANASIRVTLYPDRD